ncbi:hypothetical protein DWB61_12995 [Ancylomarina euxinus]|uniref:Uncharacterized protein n=1 Tax=Ancylomarina euxinus TaxID=2283627 RepID=A0A425XYQ6_9BACT|nr:hypothetical protein [Ancylomarina euxinus]MCZ4695682.1 hypothetical protein [Ancylomarina euxinus]MUP16014.1 hypothetical protein [Ancylomarina euxinus]RRG20260.1 hypothetical protein DWB61_12995 [Ancylomarina euxinus]
MRSFFKIQVLFLILILISSRLYSQESGNEKLFEAPYLFGSDTLIELSITTNIKELIKDTGEKSKYHQARLSYQLGDSVVSMLVQLKTRGRFRKDRSICKFPPLRIKFNQASSSYTLFHGQDKLKMVGHCRNNSSRFQQMVFQEYLIYKAYQILTPESFNVRLARVTYKDSAKDVKNLEEYVFFIEDFEKMAKRNGKIPIYKDRIHQDNTMINKVTRLAVFQFMVGNTDWGVPTLHNIKIIAKTPTSRPVPVPYDFDWSSLVNAPYAVPNEILDIESIHERLYRGYKRTPEELEFVFKEFRMKKDAFYALYQNTDLLTEKEINRVIDYFDEFYEIINDPKLVEVYFIDGARQLKYK